MELNKTELELFTLVSQTVQQVLPEGASPSVKSTDTVRHLIHDRFGELLSLIAIQPHSERSGFITIEIVSSLSGFSEECVFDTSTKKLLGVVPTTTSTNHDDLLLAIAVKAVTTVFGG